MKFILVFARLGAQGYLRFEGEFHAQQCMNVAEDDARPGNGSGLWNGPEGKVIFKSNVAMEECGTLVSYNARCANVADGANLTIIVPCTRLPIHLVGASRCSAINTIVFSALGLGRTGLAVAVFFHG